MHMYGLELMVTVDNHARLISWYLAVGCRDIIMCIYTFIRWVLLQDDSGGCGIDIDQHLLSVSGKDVIITV